MARRFFILLALFASSLTIPACAADGQTFSVSFAKSLSTQTIDGRILLVLSNDPSEEPRMQINDTPKSQILFGVDVDGMQPEQPKVVGNSADGYPIKRLRDVPPGEYYVQAVLHRYETFHRADGHTVKLPMDRGEGQHWNIAPGNFYSKPQKITVGKSGTISISLDQEIPPIEVDRPRSHVSVSQIRGFADQHLFPPGISLCAGIPIILRAPIWIGCQKSAVRPICCIWQVTAWFPRSQDRSRRNGKSYRRNWEGTIVSSSHMAMTQS